jgi:colanic acid/amylovoran biosynthesis protein
MKALVLWADENSTNLGVRALAAGAAALIEQASPGADVSFQSFGLGPAPLSFGGKTAVKSLLRRSSALRDWFAQFDLIVDTRAGDSFADIYGYKRLLTMNRILDLAHSQGIPIVMAPQTIGPFSGPLGIALARHALRHAKLSVSRDSASSEFASSIGSPVDLLATDVVFALPQPLRKSSSRDVILNVSGLLWRAGPHVDWRCYRSTIRSLYVRLVDEGRSVVLLPHVLASDSNDNDVSAIEEFVATSPNSVDVVTPKTLGDVREIMAGANLVIGSRMHACLNSLSVGTPAIPMAYSRKFAPLLSDLGWNWTVDLNASSAPVTEVLEIARDPNLWMEVENVQKRAHVLLSGVTDAIARVRLGTEREGSLMHD